MIVISAFGGSGSSFLIQSLHKVKYNDSRFNPEIVSSTIHRLVDLFLSLINMKYSKKKLKFSSKVTLINP